MSKWCRGGRENEGIVPPPKKNSLEIVLLARKYSSKNEKKTVENPHFEGNLGAGQSQYFDSLLQSAF